MQESHGYRVGEDCSVHFPATQSSPETDKKARISEFPDPDHAEVVIKEEDALAIVPFTALSHPTQAM